MLQHPQEEEKLYKASCFASLGGQPTPQTIFQRINVPLSLSTTEERQWAATGLWGWQHMLPSIIASEYNQEKQRPSSFSTKIINKIGTLGPTISGLKKKNTTTQRVCLILHYSRSLEMLLFKIKFIHKFPQLYRQLSKRNNSTWFSNSSFTITSPLPRVEFLKGKLFTIDKSCV